MGGLGVKLSSTSGAASRAPSVEQLHRRRERTPWVPTGDLRLLHMGRQFMPEDTLAQARPPAGVNNPLDPTPRHAEPASGEASQNPCNRGAPGPPVSGATCPLPPESPNGNWQVATVAPPPSSLLLLSPPRTTGGAVKRKNRGHFTPSSHPRGINARAGVGALESAASFSSVSSPPTQRLLPGLLPTRRGASAMAAVEEAEEAADLGPRLGISPATPGIGRKRARPSRTTGADGSCSTAPFTSTATAPAVGPGKAESNSFASVPSPVHEQSQSAPEELSDVDCAPVSTQESSTLPPLVGGSSGKVAQQEQQQQSVASGNDAGGAVPVPTPEKVESTPRRRWKKSTKGVLRFKVMKDKVMKPKVTPKTATPRKVKKDKKQMPEDGTQHVGAGGSNKVRRKLDLDSSQSKTCFSRVELMDNLRCLANSRGLSGELTRRMRSKRGRKRKLTISPYQGTSFGGSSSALIPLWGSAQLDIACRGNHGKKLLNKVLGLTEETLRVCDVLAKWDGSDSESFEGFDIGSGPEWDQTRHMFERAVDIFIAEIVDLLGPRKCSPWGGSLIDSVVGTFLTQNVSDHLSSHAFMNLAAKFPPRKRCHKSEDCSNNTPSVDGVDENLNPFEASDTFYSVDSDFYECIDSEEEDGHDTEIKGHYGEEYNRLIGDFISNLKEKNISTWDSDLVNLVKDKSGTPICTERTLRKFIASLRPVPSSIWKELREEAYRKGYSDRSQTGDAVDWESVLHAPIAKVAKCIEARGQHYILALRIQVFLMHVKNAQDGSFDLDWLRYVSREKAKNFLLSIHGIGVKSADCIRLLSLRHKAFPVDVNVARIVTRLGWVKLQPLNGVEFHLINSYPIMRDVQRYLWPRLCTIDKEKLYELHCLMITFGKVCVANKLYRHFSYE
nr:unnamed protein product [Digitaria exilis]